MILIKIFKTVEEVPEDFVGKCVVYNRGYDKIELFYKSHEHYMTMGQSVR